MSCETTKTFEDLEAWKAARSFRVFVSQEIAPILKAAKEFSLLDQIKRSSRSVSHNIAEGYGRFHFRDNYRFCSNARGSLFESLDQLITCHDDQLIDADLLSKGRSRFEKTLKILNGYMAWLKKSAASDGAEQKS